MSENDKPDFSVAAFVPLLKECFGDDSLNPLIAPGILIATRAQSIFDEWLKKQTVVYSQRSNARKGAWAVGRNWLHTHRAYLVCSTALEKKS